MFCKSLIIFFGLLSFVLSAQARVGEPVSTIESRMGKLAVRLPSDFSEGYIKRMSSHYDFLSRYYPNMEHVVFFKSGNKDIAPSVASDFGIKAKDGSSQPPKRSRNGWVLHIISVDGKSMIEAYYREGAGITDAETNVILNVNSRGNKWLERTDVEAETKQQFRTTFGLTHILSDGSLRARVDGGTIVFFTSKVDEMLASDKAADSVVGF